MGERPRVLWLWDILQARLSPFPGTNAHRVTVTDVCSTSRSTPPHTPTLLSGRVGASSYSPGLSCGQNLPGTA